MTKSVVVLLIIAICLVILSSCSDDDRWISSLHPYLSFRLLDKMSLIEGEVNSFMDFSELYILSYPSDIEEDITNELDSGGVLMFYPMENQKLQSLIMGHFGFYFTRHNMIKNIESEMNGYLWVNSSEQQFLSTPQSIININEIMLIDINNDRLIYVHYDD